MSAVPEVLTFTRLMLEAQRRNVPAKLAKQALEDAVIDGIYTVIGITDDGDFIYQRVPRESREPLIPL